MTFLACHTGWNSSACTARWPRACIRTAAPRLVGQAYGEDWSTERQAQLLREVGFGTKGLDAWLRDGFFEQHCKLFHQRPFIWHIWDGRRDGFSILVNYHKLDAANLNKLIYTYLGEWIREPSEPPKSLAHRGPALGWWRPWNFKGSSKTYGTGNRTTTSTFGGSLLHEQPMGWNPDLNDGVRLNIRPFVTAGVLRSRVNVNWKKDRGRNSDGSERLNDDAPYLGAEARC